MLCFRLREESFGCSHLPLEFLAPCHEGALEVVFAPPLLPRHRDGDNDDDEKRDNDHTDDDEGAPPAPAAPRAVLFHRAAEVGEKCNSLCLGLRYIGSLPLCLSFALSHAHTHTLNACLSRVHSRDVKCAIASPARARCWCNTVETNKSKNRTNWFALWLWAKL